jgi:protein TonB
MLNEAQPENSDKPLMTSSRDRQSVPTFQPVDREPWISSLRVQIKQLLEERKSPPPKAELSVEADPSALDKLVDNPWPGASLVAQLQVIVHNLRHPEEKFVATAEPVEVDEVWSRQNRWRSFIVPVAGYVLVVLLAIFPIFGSGDDAIQITETYVPLIAPPLFLDLPAEEEESGGGGGGGREEETPPSLGELPRAAEEQLVPPSPEPPANPDPILVAEPTVVAPQLADPQRVVDLGLLGSPEGIPGPPSAGPGTGGGIGDGTGTGVGEGDGPGVGEGEGGGTGGGIFNVGGGVTMPVVVKEVQPQYSEEARKARFEGTVLLEAIVRKDGTVEIVRVVRGLGFGLDQNAIEALRQWEFRPALRNGEPVDVSLNVEVNFNLR